MQNNPEFIKSSESIGTPHSNNSNDAISSHKPNDPGNPPPSNIPKRICLNKKSSRFSHLIDRKLEEKTEEFFRDAWCYKSDKNFQFTFDDQIINRVATVRYTAGNREGQSAECRLINFDNGFAGWSYMFKGKIRLIISCHIRVDKNIPKQIDEYNFFSPFHATLEFGDGESVHFRFDEHANKVGYEWNHIEEHHINKMIVDLITNLGKQFVGQVQLRHLNSENLLYRGWLNYFFNNAGSNSPQMPLINYKKRFFEDTRNFQNERVSRRKFEPSFEQTPFSFK